MPNSYTEVYFPVLVQGILAIIIAAALIILSYALGKRVRNKIKDTPYESGITPTGDARSRFSTSYFGLKKQVATYWFHSGELYENLRQK